jgi:S1-C subfamily serine protease
MTQLRKPFLLLGSLMTLLAIGILLQGWHTLRQDGIWEIFRSGGIAVTVGGLRWELGPWDNAVPLQRGINPDCNGHSWVEFVRFWTRLFPTQSPFRGTSSSRRSAPSLDVPAALQPHYDPKTGYYDPLGPAEYTLEELVAIAVYVNVNRSVVNINTRGIQGRAFFFLEIPTEGEGSGVVLDKRGHILTNFHVVEGAEQIQVTLFDGSSYEAQIVGGDAATDVAVLRITAPPEKLYPVVFGDSSKLRVGQKVFAIGNPFGLERTMSSGIIASLNRELPSKERYRKITQVIQIDAAINPGNSGGPLLDSHSRMIGMNTAIASRTGESAGVGFAIPVNTVAKVVPQLIERGRVIRPDIGIARVYQTEAGLLIAALVPGGAAERAGLRGPKIIRRQRRQGPFVYESQIVDRSAADLIVGVDGQPTLTVEDFLNTIESHEPGDRVIINVIREGKEMAIPVTLDAGG